MTIGRLTTITIKMDDATIRAVALVAAALQPFPGSDDLFERADSFFTYIKTPYTDIPEEE